MSAQSLTFNQLSKSTAKLSTGDLPATFQVPTNTLDRKIQSILMVGCIILIPHYRFIQQIYLEEPHLNGFVEMLGTSSLGLQWISLAT